MIIRLCSIPVATFTVRTPLLHMPCFRITSTFILPLHAIGIDVPLAAFTVPCIVLFVKIYLSSPSI